MTPSDQAEEILAQVLQGISSVSKLRKQKKIQKIKKAFNDDTVDINRNIPIKLEPRDYDLSEPQSPPNQIDKQA